MEIYRTVEKIQSAIEKRKGRGHRIGFVPTMGALHDGHKSLLTRARSENETVVCSIFVNPTQFNEKKDLDHYPRTLDTDVELLQQVPTDLFINPFLLSIYKHINASYSGFLRVERPDYSGRTLLEPDVRNYRIRLPNKQTTPCHIQ